MRTYSIIIPCEVADQRLQECLQYCSDLDYPQQKIEIFVLPDELPSKDYHPDPEIVFIPTGVAGPSYKRNLGVSKAKGEICAFIDSDAYPAKNWLQAADKAFDDPEIAVVGGPNLTPEDNTLRQKANGIILGSLIGAGASALRYRKKTAQALQELPSCNLFIRKEVLEKIGGFSEDLFPSEDAKVCFQIKDLLGLKIYYDPEVVVYHHRRPLFLPFLKQIWHYGVTKGFLMREFFSLKRLYYFIPTLFLLWLLLTPFFFFWQPLKVAYLILILLYLLTILWMAIRSSRNGLFKWLFLLFSGTILTHFCYGIAFFVGILAGLSKKKLGINN